MQVVLSHFPDEGTEVPPVCIRGLSPIARPRSSGHQHAQSLPFQIPTSGQEGQEGQEAVGCEWDVRKDARLEA